MTLEDVIRMSAGQRNMTIEQYFDYCSKTFSPEYAKTIRGIWEKSVQENKAEK